LQPGLSWWHHAKHGRCEGLAQPCRTLRLRGMSKGHNNHFEQWSSNGGDYRRQRRHRPAEISLRRFPAATQPRNLIARDRSVFRSKPEINMYLIKVPTSRHLYLMQSTARDCHSALYSRPSILLLTSRLTRLHAESYVAQDAYN
jgi:hypothetical protein